MNFSQSNLITARSHSLFDLVNNTPHQEPSFSLRKRSNESFLQLSRYDQRLISDTPQYYSQRDLPVLNLQVARQPRVPLKEKIQVVNQNVLQHYKTKTQLQKMTDPFNIQLNILNSVRLKTDFSKTKRSLTNRVDKLVKTSMHNQGLQTDRNLEQKVDQEINQEQTSHPYEKWYVKPAIAKPIELIRKQTAFLERSDRILAYDDLLRLKRGHTSSNLNALKGALLPQNRQMILARVAKYRKQAFTDRLGAFSRPKFLAQQNRVFSLDLERMQRRILQKALKTENTAAVKLNIAKQFTQKRDKVVELDQKLVPKDRPPTPLEAIRTDHQLISFQQ